MTYRALTGFALAAISSIALAQTAPPPQLTPAAKPGLATPPEGWAYLPELAIWGPAKIYSRVLSAPGDPGPAVQMHAHTARNVGILTRNVSMPLTPETQLQWSWKVDQLPSKVPENIIPKHDYFSIAVKFDNGRDLTYMWSAGLAEGFGFDCPLPGWTGREYHVVVRSGEADLGKWLAEDRNVAADYAKYVGGKMPRRIEQVWLISASIIQQGEANASFGDIMLSPGGQGTAQRVF